jgi:hypothetical protein
MLDDALFMPLFMLDEPLFIPLFIALVPASAIEFIEPCALFMPLFMLDCAPLIDPDIEPMPPSDDMPPIPLSADIIIPPSELSELEPFMLEEEVLQPTATATTAAQTSENFVTKLEERMSKPFRRNFAKPTAPYAGAGVESNSASPLCSPHEPSWPVVASAARCATTEETMAAW